MLVGEQLAGIVPIDGATEAAELGLSDSKAYSYAMNLLRQRVEVATRDDSATTFWTTARVGLFSVQPALNGADVVGARLEPDAASSA